MYWDMAALDQIVFVLKWTMQGPDLGFYFYFLYVQIHSSQLFFQRMGDWMKKDGKAIMNHVHKIF